MAAEAAGWRGHGQIRQGIAVDAPGQGGGHPDGTAVDAASGQGQATSAAPERHGGGHWGTVVGVVEAAPSMGNRHGGGGHVTVAEVASQGGGQG